MRTLCTIAVAAIAAGILASGAADGATIYYGELNSITSTTDSHLDLNPATKVYAIDIGSSADVTVDNGTYSLTFDAEWPTGASLGGDPSHSHANTPSEGFDPNVSGAGAAELKTLLGTVRVAGYWDGSTWENITSTQINLAVQQGVTYDLQLLIAENYYADAGQRGGNILLDGVLLVENFATASKTGDPLVYHYTFTAASDVIQLDIQRAAAGTFNDNSGIISALTLSTVPEPSTLALLTAGLLGLLCYAWRKRR